MAEQEELTKKREDELTRYLSTGVVGTELAERKQVVGATLKQVGDAAKYYELGKKVAALASEYYSAALQRQPTIPKPVVRKSEPSLPSQL